MKTVFILKTFFLINTVLIIFVSLFLSPSTSSAVYFASDKVTIYENGKRLNGKSIIFVASYKTYSEKCTGGVCSIGQQFYPVTIHKAKNGSTLLTFSEFSSQHPYEGGKYDGAAKDSWNDEKRESYLGYLDENSDYSTNFNPGPSEGGEGCGSPGCIGGRIGDPRSFSLDIVNGDYEVRGIMKILGYNLPIQYIVILPIVIIVISVVIFYFTKRKSKYL